MFKVGTTKEMAHFQLLILFVQLGLRYWEPSGPSDLELR